MLKKMQFVGGCFLFSLFSLLSLNAGAQSTLLGPVKIVPPLRDAAFKTYSFAGPSNNVEATLILKFGDGSDLSPRTCSGKGLELAKCKIENVVRQLEVLLTRPQVVEVKLNNQDLVTRQNYQPVLGTMNLATRVNAQNSLKVKVQGIPTSSVTILVKSSTQAPQPLPVANFSLDPVTGIAPQTVVLNAMLSSSQGGTITAYEWDFGDGQFAVGSLVTHVFANAGTYPIKLTVTDNLGQKSSLTKNLDLLQNQTPVADFSFTTEGLSAQFAADLSRDPDGILIKYQWDFGDATVGEGLQATHTYAQAGSYNVKLTVTDDKGAVQSLSKSITLTIPMPPVAKISVHSAKTGMAPLMMWIDGKKSSDPNQLPLTMQWDFGDGTQSAETGSLTHEYKSVGQYVVKLTVTNTNGLSSTDQFTVNVTAPQLPSDPKINAPPLLQTAVQSLSESTAFLYSGPNPVQLNVNTDVLDKNRTAVVSGTVFSDQGGPVSGVKVMILNAPDYGYTLSREDGRYDLVVNGGGEVVLDFSRNGYLPSQRKLTPDFKDYAAAPDVVMVQRDPQVTKVILDPAATGFVVAQGSTVTDSSGTRKATMVIPANAKATLIRPDGTSVETSTLSLRATEYTVGVSGPQKMPGTLPRTTGYMYAVELSADEGTAIGAEHVQFDQPVSVYVDNFLGFNPGVGIPVGVYSFSRALWEPQDNGVVIQVLEKVGNSVTLDIKGNGLAATAEELSALSLSSEELQVIAQQFAVGASFWRVRTDHFSPMDQNALLRPAPSVSIPTMTANTTVQKGNEPQYGGVEKCGSIIDVNRQVLGEVLPIVGAPFSLHYSSARVPGRIAERTLWMPLVGNSVPSGLLGINFKVEVAGRTFQESLVPVANLTKRFEWDGKDIFGREVQGASRAKVTIGYQFPQTFANAGNTPLSFGRLLTNTQETNVVARLPASFEEVREVAIGSYNSTHEVGGWDISIHHFYDSANKTLFYGDGSKVQAESSVGKDNKYLLQFLSKNKLAGFAGDGGLVSEAQFNKPVGAFVASDGSLYVMDSGNFRIRKITKEGLVATVVGDGTAGFAGDGGDALSAQINPSDFSMFTEDNIGNIYFSDTNNHRIRKISKTGIITTVIGTGVAGLSADNTLAINAKINGPEGVAFNEGTLYFSDTKNNLVRAVDPMGLVYTVASQSSPGVNLVTPRALKVGPESTLYVMTATNLFMISSSGRITAVGNKTFTDITSSRFYPQLPFNGVPTHISVTEDKRIFIVNSLYNNIWESAGDFVKEFTRGTKTNENVYPADAAFSSIGGMDIGKDGSMYIIDGNQIKVIRAVLPSNDSPELSITSESGNEIYVFSNSGRHLRTLNANTGSPVWTFTYSSEGLLVKVTDGDGKATELVRDNQGRVTSIVSPFGQVTQSTFNAEGYLSSLINPAGHTYSMEYQTGGLLTKFIKPSGSASRFTYDEIGQLTLDENAKGGFTQLLKIVSGGTSRINTSTGVSAGQSASMQNSILGDEVVTNISSANLSANYRSFDNDSSYVSSYQTRRNRHVANPHFGGLSSYISISMDSLIGNTIIVNSYQQRSSDKFDYEKSSEINLPATGTFTSTYDAKTRIMNLQTPSGGYQTATYDHQSRPVRMVNGDAEPVLFQYNSLGQLTNVTQGTRVTTLGYTNGLLTSVRNPAGQVVSKEYDQASRVIAETRPDGKKVLFDYDVNGNLVGVTPPGKTRHLFSFDVLDLVSSYLPPLLAGTETKTRYNYDSENKLKEVINPEGKSILYNYDLAGRISKITTEEGDYVYTYSATTGLLTSFSSPNGVTTTLSGPINQYTYTLTGGLNLAYSISEASIAGRLKTAGYTLINNGQLVSWSFDRDGNKIGNSSGAMTISRLLATQWISKIRASVTNYDFKYNKFGEIVGKSAGVVNEIPTFDLNYTRDDLGRVTTKSVANQGVQNSFGYSYDLAGRLVEVNKDGVAVERYVYDDNGNRVEGIVNGTSSVGVYDSQDRLVSYGGKTYGYNLNGELTSIVGGASNKFFAYNSFGYLKRAQVGSKVIDYILDGRNTRVGKKVDGVLAQTLVYSNEGQIIFEIDNVTQVSKAFAYASLGHAPDQMIVNDVHYIIVTDAIGSVRMVLDRSTGAIMQEMDYDSFGNVVKDTNPGFQPFGFAGGLYDRDTEVVRFGARDYNPEVGRWTSKDPILFKGGDTNLMSYVANDPVNFIDPTGKICFAVRGITKLGELGLLGLERYNLIQEYNGIGENSCPSQAETSRKDDISKRVNEIDKIFSNRSSLHGFFGDVLDSCNNTGIYGPQNPQAGGI